MMWLLGGTEGVIGGSTCVPTCAASHQAVAITARWIGLDGMLDADRPRLKVRAHIDATRLVPAASPP
jgi:hypothetical protein